MFALLTTAVNVHFTAGPLRNQSSGWAHIRSKFCGFGIFRTSNPYFPDPILTPES